MVSFYRSFYGEMTQPGCDILSFLKVNQEVLYD